MEEAPNKLEKSKGVKKRYDHLAVKPVTFEIFRLWRTQKSDDAFVTELLNVYQKRMAFLAKRRDEAKREIKNV